MNVDRQQAARNLIICCDGTNNQFGEENTNVLKLFSLAAKGIEEQLAFYDPGVGTFSATAALTPLMKWVTRQMGSAFGYGVSRNIANAYDFLSSHYQPNDRIFLFGFSRGAYIARAVAALVHACGLIHHQNRNLIPYAIELFKTESAKAEKRANLLHSHLEIPVCNAFASEFSARPPIHFLGLWDTVKSVGTIYNPLKLPFTAWNPTVMAVRHAVSIDERRKFFRQNLWSRGTGLDIKQVWFAGVHADVGGGYGEAENGLAKISLTWMLNEAIEAGFKLDRAKLPQVLPPIDSKPPPSPADPMAGMHDELAKLEWKLFQLVPRRYWAKEGISSNEFVSKWKLSPIPQRRFIAEDSWIHSSVFQRMQQDTSYRPANLPSSARDENGNPVPFGGARPTQ
jgi:uncharacterized protein (DUF2235 family)